MGLDYFKHEPEPDPTSNSKKYAKKMKPTPDEDTFEETRGANWAVGPKLVEIGGIEKLIQRMSECDTVYDWSILLNDYIKWGNNSKVSSVIGIFNLNAGTDCPNRWTDNCQVGGDECYSVRDEKKYPYALDFYRRQEYLWDCLDAQTWADAFVEILKRKHTDPVALKFCQAGDFRHEGDIIKVNYIAERLSEHGVSVFTYSASDYLDWSHATSDNLVVNCSNDNFEHGDRRYIAVELAKDIPEGAVWCPYSKSKFGGESPNERPKCGDCVMCIEDTAPDIAVVK